MFKVACAVDLHFSARFPGRIKSLAAKMQKIRPEVNAYLFPGDIFTLDALPQHWDPLIKRPILKGESKILNAYSLLVARENLPQMITAAGGLPIFMARGNADVFAMDDLVIQHKMSETLKFSWEAPYVLGSYTLAGMGGIEPDNHDAGLIRKHNPWYSGVKDTYAFQMMMHRIEIKVNDWSSTIFMTHQPAKGYLDSFGSVHYGSPVVLAMLKARQPFLHLTGHVHSAYMENNDKVFSRIGNTLSINTGGGTNHDGPDGVRLFVIDLDAVKAGKTSKKAIRLVV
jgi:Icc-related predicted phosphoesterase